MKRITAEGQSALARQVQDIVMSMPVIDVHTHLYDPVFRDLLLWGIDELLVYHYLVAEVFRYWTKSPEKFWSLSRPAQAEVIWQELFLKHSPISEACRGVLTTLNLLGLDVKKRDLPALRKWFAVQKLERQVDRCLELAGISRIYMTNSPFDDLERPRWEKRFMRDSRFEAGLRIDPLLLAWAETAPKLQQWGYRVQQDKPQHKTFDEVRRFLSDWTKKIQARYVMVSLPPGFQFPPDESAFDRNLTTQLLQQAVLPHCQEYGLPFAVMPGVKRAVNPDLKLAGDGVGWTDLTFLQNLCALYPDNKFLATILPRENQHEACVLARKFRNLHIFGCWWFTNIPLLIDEMTRMRVELLGLSFTPQHSDARVLEQVVYKWHHSRTIIAKVLIDKYSALTQTGWEVSRAEIERDVQDLFGGAFERFCGSK